MSNVRLIRHMKPNDCSICAAAAIARVPYSLADSVGFHLREEGFIGIRPENIVTLLELLTCKQWDIRLYKYPIISVYGTHKLVDYVYSNASAKVPILVGIIDGRKRITDPRNDRIHHAIVIENTVVSDSNMIEPLEIHFYEKRNWRVYFSIKERAAKGT
jgi:hypothetical protein